MMPGAKGYVLKKILYPVIKVLYNLFYVKAEKCSVIVSLPAEERKMKINRKSIGESDIYEDD